MPTATHILFRVVLGPFPSHGPRYEDVTRPGDATQRFWYVGNRGSRTTLAARKYFAGESNAQSFRNQLNALEGREVVIEDDLNNRSVTCFLHAVNLEPLKRIVSTDGSNWAVIAQLDVQRTA